MKTTAYIPHEGASGNSEQGYVPAGEPAASGAVNGPFNPADLDYFPPGEPFRNGPAEAARIEFKSLANFCREYVPLAYAIEPIVRTSSLYTLTARTGHGKTAFLIVAGLAIATGRPDILGLEVAQGRVAFLTFENPDDVRMRFMIAAYLLNIDLDEVNSQVMILDARAKPENVSSALKPLADAEPFTLVVIDTLADFSTAMTPMTPNRAENSCAASGRSPRSKETQPSWLERTR